MEIWARIQQELGSLPVIEGAVAGATPLYAERYLISGGDHPVAGMPLLCLITKFGGARVLEGDPQDWRFKGLATQSLLVPPGYPTYWRFTGSTDFAMFYFTHPQAKFTSRLLALFDPLNEPLMFSHSLVSATAQEIFNELQKGRAADEPYIEKLVEVMLEKIYRALTTAGEGGLAPSHVHFSRLSKALQYIRGNLGGDLSVEFLANLAGVSQTHFRRLFQEALGTSVHQYVQGARLEQARKFLGTTRMPISRIAEECGFSSQSHLTTSFRKVYSATPAEYRTQVSMPQT